MVVMSNQNLVNSLAKALAKERLTFGYRSRYWSFEFIIVSIVFCMYFNFFRMLKVRSVVRQINVYPNNLLNQTG